VAKRIFIEATASELRELSQELHRIGDLAALCAKEILKSDRPYKTDGFKKAIDGLDAVSNLLGGVLGVFNSPPAEMSSIRGKILEVQILSRAADQFVVAAEAKRAQASDSNQKADPLKSKATPSKPDRKSSPTKLSK